jgi:sentrin-specific protease 8
MVTARLGASKPLNCSSIIKTRSQTQKQTLKTGLKAKDSSNLSTSSNKKCKMTSGSASQDVNICSKSDIEKLRQENERLSALLDETIKSNKSFLKTLEEINSLKFDSWLTDVPIQIYIDTLCNNRHQIGLGSGNGILVLNPLISQAVKLHNVEESAVFLDPLDIRSKEVLLFPINNSKELTLEGGSHWSLLCFVKSTTKFYYYDSYQSLNLYDAQCTADKLVTYLGLKEKIDLKKIVGPTQNNSYDCAIYLLLAIDYLMLNYVENKEVGSHTPLLVSIRITWGWSKQDCYLKNKTWMILADKISS